MNTFIMLGIVLASVSSFSESCLQETALAGTWKGESICANRASACHDELVVYHITQEAPGIVNVSADRIVEGNSINMGSLMFNYDQAKGTLYNKTGDNVWQFAVKSDKTMEGVLLRDGAVFRRVTLRRGVE